MNIESLDKTTIWSLTIIGGLFAIVGLYLIIRRSSGEDTAKIEIFGLKFQSSSAGTLVFLIGSTFLFTPLIVPEKPINIPSVSTNLQKVNVDPQSEKIGLGSSENRINKNVAIILPNKAGAKEHEPNNFLTEANQIARKEVYAGRLDKSRKDYEDWYVIPTNDIKNQDMRIQIRSLSGGVCRIFIFNELEEEMKSNYCKDNGGSVNINFFHVAGDYIFIKVEHFTGASLSYELIVH